MLSKSKREKIRNVNLYEAFYKEKEGLPYSLQKPVRIPDFWEIKQDAIKKLLKKGFNKVEPVEPSKANCIIRIFTKRHFEYQPGEIHNIYGYNCFVKEDGLWLSESNNVFTINFTKHIITCYLLQDESVDYDCDFVDCYVKIS